MPVSKTVDGGSNPSTRAKENSMKVINYISDSFSELKNHVTWLTWPEVQRLTIIVAIFSVLFALATWGADEVLIKVIEAFYALINR